jgi:hypothetical protein
MEHSKLQMLLSKIPSTECLGEWSKRTLENLTHSVQCPHKSCNSSMQGFCSLNGFWKHVNREDCQVTKQCDWCLLKVFRSRTKDEMLLVIRDLVLTVRELGDALQLMKQDDEERDRINPPLPLQMAAVSDKIETLEAELNELRMKMPEEMERIMKGDERVNKEVAEEETLSLRDMEKRFVPLEKQFSFKGKQAMFRFGVYFRNQMNMYVAIEKKYTHKQNFLKSMKYLSTRKQVVQDVDFDVDVGEQKIYQPVESLLTLADVKFMNKDIVEELLEGEFSKVERLGERIGDGGTRNFVLRSDGIIYVDCAGTTDKGGTQKELVLGELMFGRAKKK